MKKMGFDILETPLKNGFESHYNKVVQAAESMLPIQEKGMMRKEMLSS